MKKISNFVKALPVLTLGVLVAPLAHASTFGVDEATSTINNLYSQIGEVLVYVIPLAAGLGIGIVAFKFGWRWMKKFIHG